MKRQEAIILSMTPEERAKPNLLNASRRKRIAAGSGTTVQDVNKIAKQRDDMETVMKRMKKMGGLGALGAMMGGGGLPGMGGAGGGLGKLPGGGLPRPGGFPFGKR
jgi:signal recognition particle subunit SRP54